MLSRMEGALPPGARPLVVCVDDEQPVLSALRRALATEPYEVLAVETASQALELARNRPVAVLITDQRMPDMTGLDLAREVQAVSPNTAVLLLTAYFDTAGQIDPEQVKIERLFTKPWDDRDLREAIRGALNRLPVAAGPKKIATVRCQGMTSEAVLKKIEEAAEDAGRAGLALQVVLEDLPRLEGSLTGLLLHVVRWAARGQPPVTLVDPSGFAGTLLEAVGDSPSLLEDTRP